MPVRAGLRGLECNLTALVPPHRLGLCSRPGCSCEVIISPLLLANDIISQQKLVAIYHLLKVCGEQVAMGDSSRKRFVDRIRRIEALNEDTPYRAVLRKPPTWKPSAL